MTEFPEVYSSENFIEFLQKLPTYGTPSVFDTKKLKALGYKSSYHEKNVGALKFVGLVEDKRGGGPTELWREMRGNMGKAIAKGVLTGYHDLFALYPDAHLRDKEALNSYFTANSNAPKDAVERMVATFTAFCSVADFSTLERNVQEPEELPTEGADTTKPLTPKVRLQQSSNGGPTININIQVQLPSDATGEVYEKFFESMKNKLFPHE